MARRLVIASNNHHKVAEIAAMLKRTRFPAVRALEVVSVGSVIDARPPEIPETSDEFVGNALLKVHGVATWLRGEGIPDDDLVLADDSGLCVEALDQAPGVHSARFAGPEANDADNNAKLVAELRARGLESSPAEYVCILALRYVGNRPFDFTLPDGGALFMRENCLCIEGRCSGNVRVEARGEGGFGYDPHFWVDDDRRTFAELTRGEKSQRSHRGAAVRRMVQELPLVLG